MKKLLALVIVVIAAGAAWYWWGGAATPGETPAGMPGSGEAPPSAQAVTPPAELAKVQQQVAAASAEITSLVGPVVAAEKSAFGQANRVSKVLDEVERIRKTLPRDRIDTAGVVEHVGRDRVALFNWVRDNTVLVSYSGALRGPTGVLWDRLGNSLDRALLLATLLERAGFESRLANGTLDDAARARVVSSMSGRPRPSIPPLTESPDAAALTALAQAVGINNEAYRAQLANTQAAQRALKAEAQARIAAQAQAIQSAMPATGSPAPAAAVSDDHWWVQVEEDGNWVDLDPTLPDAKPGATLTGARTTLAAADLADEQRHLLKIRVMAEIWRNGQRSEAPLLEHAFAPSQFHGQRIAFNNIPIDWPADDTFTKADRPAEAVKTALIDQVEWLPVLKIGKGLVVKQSIDDHGDLHDNTSPDANTMRLGRNVARVTDQALKGALDLFSQLPGGADEKPEPKPARIASVAFTSEWIEYELVAPGQAPVRARRVVFDSLTAEQRAANGVPQLTDRQRLSRALALAGETELLPMFAELSPAYVANLAATRVLAARGPLVALAQRAGRTIPPAIRTQISLLEPVPGVLYAIAGARFAWNPSRGATYLDRLNLVSHTRQMRLPESGGMTNRDVIDFIANDVAVWPSAGADHYRARVTQGVADTVIEGSLLASCPPGRTSCERGDNTSEVFAATGPQRWTKVSSASPAALANVASNARPLLQADLAAGYAVLMPSEPVTIAGHTAATWWRVNLATGETLGMSVDGGSVSAEAVINLIGVGLAALNCIPALRGGAPGHGSYEEFRAIACIAAVGLGGAAALPALVGESIGALGAAMGLIGALLTTDWPGIFGL